jgi:hypothetical protein
VTIISIPSGIPFQIFDSAYESPDGKILFSGETPATVPNLPAGAHRICYAPVNLPSRAASIQVPINGTATFQQEFPRGSVEITSEPAGAEVFCDQRALGITPLEVALLPGKHEIGARWESHSARVRVVNVAVETNATVAFDFRTSTGPRQKSRASKPDDASFLEKMGRSINKIFTESKVKSKK